MELEKEWQRKLSFKFTYCMYIKSGWIWLRKLAYSKTMNCTCKPQVRYSAKYLEKVRNAWLNKSWKCNTLLSLHTQPFLTPICFTSFCCTTPCQITPLLNLCSVIFSLTPSSCLYSITQTPYLWGKYHFWFKPMPTF